MSLETKILAIGGVALQLLTWNAVSQRNSAIEAALNEAASKGLTTFRAEGRQLTMLNGLHSQDGNPGCTVNLAYNDTGDIVSDWSGWYVDIFNSPRRFEIGDCSKLPKRVLLEKMYD